MSDDRSQESRIVGASECGGGGGDIADAFDFVRLLAGFVVEDRAL